MRLYPRPVSECDICSEEIILCWGEKISKYWRHKSGSHNHEPNNETHNHKLAKELIKNYLNNGGICEYTHNCNKQKNQIPNLTYKTETPYKNYRLDVGGSDDNTIKFGIEILVTHKTHPESREGLDWVEFVADDIIELLDRTDTEEKIILCDVRQKQCCFIMNESNEIDIIYNCATTSHTIKGLKIEYGRNLGYITDHTHNDDFNKLRIALNGEKYVTCKYGLELKNNDKSVWEKLINLGQCLGCKKMTKITIGRPYCYSCYNLISSNIMDSIDAKIKCEKNEILDMRNYLRTRVETSNKGKVYCTGNSTGRCIYVTLDNNNKVLAKKRDNYICNYNCKMCINFRKCERVATLGNYYCVNCDYATINEMLNNMKYNNAIELMNQVLLCGDLCAEYNNIMLDRIKKLNNDDILNNLDNIIRICNKNNYLKICDDITITIKNIINGMNMYDGDDKYKILLKLYDTTNTHDSLIKHKIMNDLMFTNIYSNTIDKMFNTNNRNIFNIYTDEHNMIVNKLKSEYTTIMNISEEYDRKYMLYKFRVKNKHALKKFNEYKTDDIMKCGQIINMIKNKINDITMKSVYEIDKIHKVINFVKCKCNLENDYGLEIFDMIKMVCESVDKEILTNCNGKLNVGLTDLIKYINEMKIMLHGDSSDQNVIRNIIFQNRTIMVGDWGLYMKNVKDMINKRSEKKIMHGILLGLCDIVEVENNMDCCKIIKELTNHIKKESGVYDMRINKTINDKIKTLKHL